MYEVPVPVPLVPPGMRTLVKPVGRGTKLLVGVLAIGMIPLLPRIGPTIPPRPLELDAEGVAAGELGLVDWPGPVVSEVSAALLLLVTAEDDAAGPVNRSPTPEVNESSKPGELGVGVGVASVAEGTPAEVGTASVEGTSVGEVTLPSVLDELVLAAPDAGGLEAPPRMSPRFEVTVSRRPPDELAVGVKDAATGEGTATGEEPVGVVEFVLESVLSGVEPSGVLD